MLHLLFALFLVCVSAGPYGCSGTQNLQPIYSAPPTFVKSVPNGKLFTTGSVEPPIAVVHVWGTPYQMGFAHGQLTKANSIELYADVLEYIQEQVEQSIEFIPKFLRDLIAEYGIEAGLEMTYWLTESYIPQYFLDELKGFSDATGIDYMTVVRVHMFPEIIKAHCSMVGAWGAATIHSNSSGKLVQLRALDWATNGPFQNYPQVTVYHPADPRSQPFSIFGFVGFIGAMSGVSSVPLGICEKVWLAYNGTSSRSGIPWHFMLRDILQFDKTVDDAINRVNHAERTCSIHIGVGDPVNNFRVMEYSYESVTVYDDGNYPVYENHPRLPSVVYVNKHVQPSTDPCLGTMLQQNYGKIDALFLIQSVVALHETGDTHAAVYDYGNDALFVSTAGIYTKAHGAVPAYKRPWTKLSLSALWSVQPDPVFE